MNERVWVVDDDASIRWVLTKALDKAGLSVQAFEDGNGISQALAQEHPDVIMTDIRMPGMSGLELLEVIQKQAPEVPVIIMTAHTDLDSAVASYQGGAFEYLPKPFDVDDAINLVRRAIDHHHKDAASKEPVPLVSEIIGEAPAMQEVFRAIGRLANSRINVLIYGESGTGKELVASALHMHSPRAKQAFIAINTAAIPAELLESELFGHEKGAFTGAHSQRKGRFEQAHGGTLFLDEIGDMPAALQTRLLRVLSDNRFYRVGGHEQIEVDVRIIAATNQDLEKRVAQGKFREDLYHRLNVIRISLPALRERSEDIPLLAQHFLQRSAEELQVDAKKLSPQALEKLTHYHWPGNVRQLENMCRWMTVMAPGQVVTKDDLPPELEQSATPSGQGEEWSEYLKKQAQLKLSHGDDNILNDLAVEFERVLLRAALDHTHGHKQEAAKRLGWGRNTLTRKLKELGVDI